MSALLLEPHHDDATLFACWTVLKYKPTILTVHGLAQSQEPNGITGAERSAENKRAFYVLGVHDLWAEWPFSDIDPPWHEIEDTMRGQDSFQRYARVFAPWPEPKGGNPHHDRIGELARDIFGDRVTFYTTYRVGGQRTVGTPSEPEPWMIPLKLRALACYESQILRGPRRFWMHSLQEWTMP